MTFRDNGSIDTTPSTLSLAGMWTVACVSAGSSTPPLSTPSSSTVNDCPSSAAESSSAWRTMNWDTIPYEYLKGLCQLFLLRLRRARRHQWKPKDNSSDLFKTSINPFSPKQEISLYVITIWSNNQAMRIKKVITKDVMSSYLNKISLPVAKEMYGK